MDIEDDRFLRLDAVIAKTGCPRASIYRAMKNGTFPIQEQIGCRAVGWRLSKILRWMECPRDYKENGP